MSAKIPPVTAIGVDAKIPHSDRNMINANQLGATAHASVKMVKSTKLPIMTTRRP